MIKKEQLLNPRSVLLIYQAEPTLDNNYNNQMFTIVIKLIKTVFKIVITWIIIIECYFNFFNFYIIAGIE
jgi:hypothetical protein